MAGAIAKKDRTEGRECATTQRAHLSAACETVLQGLYTHTVVSVLPASKRTA